MNESNTEEQSAIPDARETRSIILAMETARYAFAGVVLGAVVIILAEKAAWLAYLIGVLGTFGAYIQAEAYAYLFNGDDKRYHQRHAWGSWCRIPIYVCLTIGMVVMLADKFDWSLSWSIPITLDWFEHR